MDGEYQQYDSIIEIIAPKQISSHSATLFFILGVAPPQNTVAVDVRLPTANVALLQHLHLAQLRLKTQ